MTSTPTEPPPPGENTRAVHLPQPPVPSQEPLGAAVWRSATYAFPTSQEYADVLGDRAPGYTYSRIDNPTTDGFAAAVAALEGVRVGGVTGQAFASGMAAISAVLLAYTHAGAHVVAPAAAYGGTYGLLAELLSRFGVQTDFVDMTDVARVRAAIRPETRVVWAETLANPTMAVADLPALAEAAHEAGAMLVVDSTFATPVVCRPLEHGADLVVHSATKYIGGHSDATGGVVVGRTGVMGPVRTVRIHTGGSLAPDEAFLLRRGLETLPLRVRRQCDTAALLAAAAARHPAVARVDYPGLPGHPSRETARRLFDAGPEGTRFGAVVTITPFGGTAAGMALADGLRLAKVATSLGGTHTLAGHIASTTHRQMDERALTAAGIDPGAVRFSVGLEDADDLIVDVNNALTAIRRSGEHQRAFNP
jgi:cystathionine beta-lyase/cystathionine gamma-synthase